MTLADQLLSPNFFASQGALESIRYRDALSWTQNPALLGEILQTQVSTATYLVYPNLQPKPSEKTAMGTQVMGLTAPGMRGTFGAALSMPLGQNVWVDTGSRESTSLFNLSRMSAFSIGLGWGHSWGDGWSGGIQIPVLFRSNTTTEIYLTQDQPWARARTGVKPYLGWHVGIKKQWVDGNQVSFAYREKQASKIEFGVKGQVDFASIALPLDAAGSSEILFEPRRMDLQWQKRFLGNWLAGLFARWSQWKSAPPLGLVIDSKIPQITTDPSRVTWQDQWELAASVARHFDKWTPILSYRYRTRAVLASNDYWDYDEHVVGLGVHYEVIADDLWLSGALRVHRYLGGGTLNSVLVGLDWAL